MYYRGYDIQNVNEHYRVSGNGESWTEDTVEEAKQTIDISIEIQEKLKEV